ncbi:hypothetical protein F4692_001201 [Nocardioides cavernae]|uniref:Uncharacterized protein n=1 Tax=Nocardioides cavernae TaxID=1921566 RepID=A0A7Y9H176_9ACTN|nr:hypothetical protein [Nocardioides cavernae]NYE36097.1 hypothetical protein [Nocardioides cavernae]
MPGYYETQVRRALLTVGDADVLNEMATGWRTSIRDLNTVDDRLARAIRGLRDRDQLGDQTRDAAIGAFREMRDYVADQRLMLGKTAQALDAAGGALGQVKALVRSWDRAGDPTPPGRPPVADPAQEDQTEYWRLATLHRRQSVAYAAEVQQREDEARDAWESLNRIFGTAEDKIRSAHGIPREERPTTEPPPVYPPPDWPGPEPQPPVAGWPPLPPWPPVDEKPPPGPKPGPGPGPGLPPGGPGPGLSPGVPPAPEPGPGHPQPGGGSHPGQPSAPSHPTTTVAGSAQSGVTYAPGGAAPAAFSPGSAAGGLGAPMAMPSLGGAAGAAAGTAAGAAMRGAAGAGGAGAGARAGGAGAARGGAQSAKGTAKGAAGSSSGRGGSRGGGRSGGRGLVGGKGSQQAARQAKSERGAGGAGGRGGRGGRRKDGGPVERDGLLGTDDHWLDDEGTAPDVLR